MTQCFFFQSLGPQTGLGDRDGTEDFWLRDRTGTEIFSHFLGAGTENLGWDRRFFCVGDRTGTEIFGQFEGVGTKN